ncbi:family 65 glycosyl hydrolase [Gilvibacter sp. SZ-19]|uniref:glycoside hydrolase family 65 protein n=1 Tax=Gilvibacter sp. SZ-19 TaxID=754429 RepID=UPI000B3C5A14|nr:glycoside hydrolase family 65 protein [Gilvibacter sp. SZ-19]ARV13095.1 family 65 glycosyl hydrolase [Gilvibacter sp. SZ-19]
MNQQYIVTHPWSIIEEGFDPERVKSSESLFSLGNGAMGQRANFEEQYSGPTFQGSYIAGVYYPDKTRVGWWKNGYPEYFAKVLNAPNWIGVNVSVDGEALDLHTCKSVADFKRELDMKTGLYTRSFKATLQNGKEVEVSVLRFLSLDMDELGVIDYRVTPLNADAQISFTPYIDAGITNEDSNWDDKFWDIKGISANKSAAFIHSATEKTAFHVCTYMDSQVFLNDKPVAESQVDQTAMTASVTYEAMVAKGDTINLEKYAGYTVSTNHAIDDLIPAAKAVLAKGMETGVKALANAQAAAWEQIWAMADIKIQGDDKAQQGIRFNIFQLNQTYLGKDPRLNIGPKGFTGEKYGGSTYWDTEAYCLPFYMATKNQEVAKNLLIYRYKHLQKAIENAQKLGFTDGAALYPMVTMNGEECHNEWEITFEEIHRNGAIAFAIFNYARYTGDTSYINEMGAEVLIGIARFWKQRATFSKEKGKYVILGVTGPNEYENNVNNNWYTNFSAQWCLNYAAAQMNRIKSEAAADYERITNKTNLTAAEIEDWTAVADGLYFPYSQEHNVFLQQDGFLDKELIEVSDLDPKQRPINQHWSWDRILRSPYIKQADTLQGFYFFEDQFTDEELERHFDFYEPFTVHESSLSPCVHAIQAAKLGRMQQAYTFYLRTSRLDLDDYNKEVEEGCHITSMAGTWMSIVEGFAGFRIRDDKPSLTPRIPEQWDSYRFRVNFRGQILTVTIDANSCSLEVDGDSSLTVSVNGQDVSVSPGAATTVNL